MPPFCHAIYHCQKILFIIFIFRPQFHQKRGKGETAKAKKGGRTPPLAPGPFVSGAGAKMFSTRFLDEIFLPPPLLGMGAPNPSEWVPAGPPGLKIKPEPLFFNHWGMPSMVLPQSPQDVRGNDGLFES